MSTPRSVNNELVLVVDVTAFTTSGFVGSSSFEGKRVDIEFDDADKGLALTRGMSARTQTKVGSNVQVLIEDDLKIQSFESFVEAISEKPRLSNSKLYYFLGQRGGAVIRIRKA